MPWSLESREEKRFGEGSPNNQPVPWQTFTESLLFSAQAQNASAKRARADVAPKDWAPRPSFGNIRCP